MTISLKHNFVSAKTDGADTTLVRPSNWNDEHALTLATARLLGRTTAGTGAAEEISAGTGLSLASGSLAAEVSLTNSVTLTNKTLTNPTVTNYVETPYSANSSTAITIDLANGTVQIITLTGSPTITMPTAVSGKSFVMLLKTGTGSYTVTWTTVKWAGGTAPTITSTASRMDMLSFFSDGTNWYGCVLGQNYTP